MKKITGSFIPFIFFHIFCCGALLFLLISSGTLLIMRQEGRTKLFLLPIIFISGFLIWLYRRHGKCCRNKGYKTFTDHIYSIFLYIIFSFLLGIAFMIYIFIPWWIPDYKGGFLLP